METPKEEFGITLGRIARWWRVKMDNRLARLGLTQAKWITLYHLVISDGPVLQRELATMIGVEGPTLVRLLDGLERKGLVKREAAPHDRRSKLVHLTDKAQPLVEELRVVAHALRDEVLGDVSPQDLAACLRVLRHVQKNLEAA